MARSVYLRKILFETLMKRNKKSIFALCSFEPTIFKMRGLPMGRYAGNILPRFFNAPDERVTPRNLNDSAECPMRGNNWTPADPFFISFLSQNFIISMSAIFAPISEHL